MIPILYEKDETLFASNGLGRLRDCISCKCVEERNSIYEVDFEYPLDGAHFEDIRLGRIIGVTHDDSGDIQPFDIVSYSRPIDGVVTFHCTHISYRQSYLTVTGSNINSLADAFTLLENAEPSNPFTYQTDKTSTGYLGSADGVPKSVRSMLGGIEGSILDIYGGEYEWDRWTVKLWQNRGQYRDFSIRYGVNMLDYQDETDSSGTYSSVVPYWTDGTTTVVGDRQDATNPTITGRGECVPLDVSDRFESQPTKAQVEAMGLSVLNSQNAYLPTQNISVSFVRLQDMSEYAGMQNLLRCGLCDTIKVIFPDYNSSGQFKIVKTVWDVLADRYEEMELGDLSISLSEALGISDVQKDSKSTIEQIIERLDDITDYVVEQGTSGVWHYRKWNSGKREAWAKATLGSVAVTNANVGYGGYRSNAISVAIPSGIFTVAPNAVVTKSTAQAGWIANAYATVPNKLTVYYSAGQSITLTNQTLTVYAWQD